MAKLKEVLSIQAENELEDAFYFYNLISAKVADEFLNQINSCIQSILLYPESFPLDFETYHKAVVHKFPFCNHLYKNRFYYFYFGYISHQ